MLKTLGILEGKYDGEDAADMSRNEEISLRDFCCERTWIREDHELARGALENLQVSAPLSEGDGRLVAPHDFEDLVPGGEFADHDELIEDDIETDEILSHRRGKARIVSRWAHGRFDVRL